jgi:hypothetical protein
MAKSDEELREWTLSGQDGSYVHQMGQTEMNMRYALRTAEASQQMTNANREMVEANKQMAEWTKMMMEANQELVKQTKMMVTANRELVNQPSKLVWSTWGVVAITLLTQAALIIITLRKPYLSEK